MIEFLKTTQGKLAALLVFYVPFFCALFFGFFDGKTYESPIGGCCIPMEGVIVAGYGLFTIWIFAPGLLIYGIYTLFKQSRE
jgi:hypothetical protein